MYLSFEYNRVEVSCHQLSHALSVVDWFGEGLLRGHSLIKTFFLIVTLSLDAPFHSCNPGLGKTHTHTENPTFVSGLS